MKNENVFYGHNKDVVRFFNQPLFFGDKVSKYLQSLVDDTNFLFNQSYSIINRDSSYLKFLGISPEIIDLSRDINPVSIFRIDGTILKESKKLMFLEFNANNPGGLYNSDNLEKILLENDPAIKGLEDRYIIKNYRRMDAFCDMIISGYNQFKFRTGKDLGNLLLILGNNKEPSIAYEQVSNSLEKKGFEVAFSNYDDRNLIYDGSSVFFNGKKVAIINRRVESKESFSNLKHISKASFKDDVFIMNKFASSIFGMKKFFLLLQDPDFQSKLSKNSVDFIKEYIPQTFDFNDLESVSTKYLMENRDKYVIKLNNSEQGVGVFVGKNYSSLEWKSLIRQFKKNQNRLKNSTIIVQEFLDMTKINSREYDYNLLSINGVFMPFARVAKGENMKTNIAQGGQYIPCFSFFKS